MQVSFTTKFILRTARTRGDQTPIYCRISVGIQRAEFATKRTVSISQWNNGKVKGNSEEARTVNTYLKQIEAEIFEHYLALVGQKKPITADSLKEAYLGIEPDNHTLLQIVEYHNTQLKETVEFGTLKNYFTTQKYVCDFLIKKYKVRDIALEELTYKFLTEFELYLRTYEPADHHKSMGNNTVMKHIERLRKIINVAVKNEWISRDPFIKFKKKFIKTQREFLTEIELESIEDKSFNIDRLNFVRNLFVFSCYTGLAYSDVMSLKPINISIGIDGAKWIATERQKTHEAVRVPLLPKALELIENYKSEPRALAAGRLFPSISNQKLNGYLKEVADLCGIEKKLTFHLARHTFATTVTLTNGVPIETVSKMLGHTSIRTTQIYARVIESKVSQDMASLKETLQSKSLKKKGPVRNAQAVK
jgi:integrase/recombinase XerD